MAHRTPGPAQAAAALLRALAAVVVLLALVAGAPYGLLALGYQPTELSSGIDLMGPVDGTLLLVVLTLIGWAAWATFTFSVAVELVAVARRRSAPRLKGLGSMQSLASFLVGGIVLIAPTATAAAAPSSAAAVSTQTPHTAQTPETGQTPAPTETSPTTAAVGDQEWPTHTVTSATESPWDLAEEYLGNGQRWKDIAALNPEVPELAAGDAYLPVGTIINLPTDAHTKATTSPPPDTTTSPPAGSETVQPSEGQHSAEDDPAAGEQQHDGGDQAPVSRTAQEGDNLWKIADQYGDATDWPTIFEANKGEKQPGGGRFTDPDLIFPGQELDIPSSVIEDQPTADEHSVQEAPTTGDSAPTNEEVDHSEQQPAPDASTDSGDRAEEQPAPPAQSAPEPADSLTPPAPEAEQQQPSSDESAVAPAALWAGAGAMAAALVATLTLRRILQQRSRRPGRRIPMPTGSAAATEQSLRAVQHPTGFDLLNRALRSLALNLAAADRGLPTVEAVVLHESRVDLHLNTETEPCPPFTAAAGRPCVWTAAASSPGIADPEDRQAADFPYPGLASLGWDAQGRLVLVDLEHVGILNLTGDLAFARHVLQALAVELANNPLPGHLELTALAATTPGLEHASPERVVRADDPAQASTDLADHLGDQRRTLAALGVDSLHTARLRDDAGDAWTPHIVLAQDLADDDTTADLFAAMAERPRTAGAVITTNGPGTPAGSAWNLECHSPEDTVVLPGSGLPIHLQGLDDDRFADALHILNLAASDADVPAPDWTRPDHDDADALPEEYSDLEDEALDDHPADADTASDAVPAEEPLSRVSLSKAEPGHQEEEAAPPAAGPTLADVLAEDATEPQEQPAPAAPEPDSTPPPRATPCAPAPMAVSASLPTSRPTAPEMPEPTAPAVPDDVPAVLLLGPVTIQGATGRVASNRVTVGTELAAFLALNPGVDHNAIDEALWPGRRGDKNLRNSVVSRLRSWLGKDTDGNPHFPRTSDTGDNRYRLGPHVFCDWHRFQTHARAGLTDHGEDGDLALRRALALVRGRPLVGVTPQRYAWAEPDVQEMVSAIVDVAHELSTRRREAGDITGALWAARRGLAAAEESELLHRAVFLAHHQAGDIEALREAAARLRHINDQLGAVDMQHETAELLHTLLPRPAVRTR